MRHTLVGPFLSGALELTQDPHTQLIPREGR